MGTHSGESLEQMQKRQSNRYSLNQNCWDNLLFSCPPNVGVQDLVS